MMAIFMYLKYYVIKGGIDWVYEWSTVDNSLAPRKKMLSSQTCWRQIGVSQEVVKYLQLVVDKGFGDIKRLDCMTCAASFKPLWVADSLGKTGWPYIWTSYFFLLLWLGSLPASITAFFQDSFSFCTMGFCCFPSLDNKALNQSQIFFVTTAVIIVAILSFSSEIKPSCWSDV